MRAVRPRSPGDRAVDPQSRRNVAVDPWPTDQRRDGEPGRQDALPSRAHRRGPRQRPAGCLADRPARHSRAALLGSQDQEHPRQSPQGRPAQVKRSLHKVALHKVMHAHNQPAAPSAARQFADRFEEGLPQCGCMPARRPRRTAHLLPLQIRGATSKVRTPNAIERRFREVRRPTRPMGTFQDKTSMDRILFAVFSHENKSQSVTQTIDVTGRA